MAFNSVIISSTMYKCAEGHLLVVLPEWQGLGLGWRFDVWLGEHLALKGMKYRNATTHPRLIQAFDKSPRWKAEGVKRAPRVVTQKLGMRVYNYVPMAFHEATEDWLWIKEGV